MRVSFSADGDFDDQGLQTEIATNLLGPMRVTAAVLPHLVRLREGNIPTQAKRRLEWGTHDPLASLDSLDSYFDQCLVWVGVCDDGSVPGLLRDQSRDSFLDSVFAASTAELWS